MKHEIIRNIDLPEFDQAVIDTSYQHPVVVDLWAEWCPPCLVLAPVLEQVVLEYAGKVSLVKVDVDEEDNMKIAGRYQVRGFPTVLLIQDGQERDRFYSAKPKSFIEDFINKWL